MLPLKFKKYFWDCAFNSLEWQEHKTYISERLMNYGNNNDIKWLKKKLSLDEIICIVQKSKNIDKKTKNYWLIINNE